MVSGTKRWRILLQITLIIISKECLFLSDMVWYFLLVMLKSKEVQRLRRSFKVLYSRSFAFFMIHCSHDG